MPNTILDEGLDVLGTSSEQPSISKYTHAALFVTFLLLLNGLFLGYNEESFAEVSFKRIKESYLSWVASISLLFYSICIAGYLIDKKRKEASTVFYTLHNLLISWGYGLLFALVLRTVIYGLSNLILYVVDWLAGYTISQAANSGQVTFIVIAVVVALLVAATHVLWYWWSNHRDNQGSTEDQDSTEDQYFAQDLYFEELRSDAIEEKSPEWQTLNWKAIAFFVLLWGILAYPMLLTQEQCYQFYDFEIHRDDFLEKVMLYDLLIIIGMITIFTIINILAKERMGRIIKGLFIGVFVLAYLLACMGFVASMQMLLIESYIPHERIPYYWISLGMILLKAGWAYGGAYIFNSLILSEPTYEDLFEFFASFADKR